MGWADVLIFKAMEKSIFRNLETRKLAFFLKLDMDSVPQRGAQGADLGSEVMFT